MLQERIAELDKFVEPDRVRREVYTDPQIFELEMQRIHETVWIYCGHESQVPNPNDYFVSRMGEESVILTRDRQGNIHVLLNTCRPRVRYLSRNRATLQPWASAAAMIEPVEVPAIRSK